MINIQEENQFQLGAITYFYESGKRNILDAVGVISTGINDPGGKSYGIYQFASRVGTLKNFIQFFNQNYAKYFKDNAFQNLFNNVVLASDEFDKKWQFLAAHATLIFGNIQHDFIAETHFNSLIQYLSARNIQQDQLTPAIQESLWSLGVQHRKAITILQTTLDELNTISDELEFIHCLYKHRAIYVQRLETLNALMKQSICARYQKECAEIIEVLVYRKDERLKLS